MNAGVSLLGSGPLTCIDCPGPANFRLRTRRLALKWYKTGYSQRLDEEQANPASSGSDPFNVVYVRRLYRELGVPPPQADAIDGDANVGADDGNACREPGYRAEEVPKEDHDAVELDEKPNQRPS